MQGIVVVANKLETKMIPMTRRVRLSLKPRICEGPAKKRKTPMRKQLEIRMNRFWILLEILGTSKVPIM